MFVFDYANAALMSNRRGDDHDDLLRVDPGASLAECRAAYIALAKRWHPDRNDDPDAHRQFHQLSLAYAAARDRAAAALGPRPVEDRVPQIIRCSRCDEESLYPRKAEYVGLISLLVWSWRWRVGGIFCTKCARRAAWKTSAVSMALGWWSLPGVVLTLPCLLKSLSGGRQDKAINVDLACHNLLVLQAAGDVENARLLAQHIAAQGASLPVSVAYRVNSLVTPRRSKGT